MVCLLCVLACLLVCWFFFLPVWLLVESGLVLFACFIFLGSASVVLFCTSHSGLGLNSKFLGIAQKRAAEGSCVPVTLLRSDTSGNYDCG